jgi:hypothetical protein
LKSKNNCLDRHGSTAVGSKERSIDNPNLTASLYVMDYEKKGR